MYYLHIDRKTERYADPKEAGKAFYKADPNKKPTLTIKEGGEEIALASTYIGKDQEGNEHGIKRISSTGNKEDGFIRGYYGELEKSLGKALQSVNWTEIEAGHKEQVPNIGLRFYEDLSMLAKRDPAKAEKLWSDNVPKEYSRPAFVEPSWEKTKEEIKELSSALRGIDGRQTEKEAEKGSWNNLIEPEETIERARQNREREMQSERDRLGVKAEVKRQEVEELTETAKAEDRENRQSERLNQRTNFQKQEQTEKEKERQIELMEQVHKQFHSTGSKFLYKDHKRDIAFKEKESKLITNTNDERVAKAMATVAAAKGWNTIKVSGHPEFQREVWLAGTLHGIEVRGYTPTERDMKLAEKELERSMRNQVINEKWNGGTERVDPSRNAGNTRTEQREGAGVGHAGLYTGSLVSHGAAPYKHDQKEKQSYFVTIETEQGRKTIWGKDLERSFEGNSSVQTGDKITLTYQGKKPVEVGANVRDENGKVVGQETIQTHRNTWEVTTNQGKVVQGVALAVANKYSKNPQQQRAVMDAMNKEIQSREKTGRVPKVELFDHTAPTKTQQQETNIQHQQDLERTR